MRGSVVKRGKSYSVVVDLGPDPETQKRRQKWHSGYRTKREAEAALTEMVGNVNAGTYIERTKQTVEEFATEWLAAIEPTVRPSTHYSYDRNIRLHVLPYIQASPMVAVDAGTLNGLYARLLLAGRRDQQGGGLSPRTVRYVHTIVHRMFKDAVKWGRLARNPADAADPPRATASGAPELVTWTPDELRSFLDKMATDRLHAAFVVLSTTGMRRGELLGLRWSDVDLDGGRASIRQTVIAVKHATTFGTPKTAKGRRTVVLDGMTVGALRRHRQAQLEERLLVGVGWRDNDLVFCKPSGDPLHPERFSRYFDRAVTRLGLRRVNLHALRHGWATMALSAGVHPKVVQERLGHANISVTLDIYSHATEALHGDAAETVAGLVFGAR